MRTEFSSLLKHKESPYKTRFEFTEDDDYGDIYDEADSIQRYCASIQGIDG